MPFALRTTNSLATNLFREGATVLLGSPSVPEKLYARGLCATLRPGPLENCSTSQRERRIVQRESCLKYSALSVHSCMLECLWKESGIFLRAVVGFRFHSWGIPEPPLHRRNTTLSAKLKARSRNCIHKCQAGVQHFPGSPTQSSG